MSNKNDFITEAMTEVEDDEGFSKKLYIDSEGYQTIGIGFCLDRIPMPRDVAEYWCRKILEARHKQIAAGPYGDTYQGMTSERKKIILNMAYQIGIGGLYRFKKMWAALEARDYQTAAKEMKDSVWYNQTKKRASRLALRME